MPADRALVTRERSAARVETRSPFSNMTLAREDIDLSLSACEVAFHVTTMTIASAITCVPRMAMVPKHSIKPCDHQKKVTLLTAEPVLSHMFQWAV